jgi:hypothetical protein
VHHHAARTFRPSEPDISGICASVAVECLCDGGGDQVHAVKVAAGIPEGFPGDEVLRDAFLFLLVVPFQVDIQVDALAAAVINGAEKAGAFGYFLAVPPLVAQQEVFVGQVAGAFKPVLKLRKDLLRRPLANAPDRAGLFRDWVPICRSRLFSYHIPPIVMP